MSKVRIKEVLSTEEFFENYIDENNEAIDELLPDEYKPTYEKDRVVEEGDEVYLDRPVNEDLPYYQYIPFMQLRYFYNEEKKMLFCLARKAGSSTIEAGIVNSGFEEILIDMEAFSYVEEGIPSYNEKFQWNPFYEDMILRDSDTYFKPLWMLLELDVSGGIFINYRHPKHRLLSGLIAEMRKSSMGIIHNVIEDPSPDFTEEMRIDVIRQVFLNEFNKIRNFLPYLIQDMGKGPISENLWLTAVDMWEFKTIYHYADKLISFEQDPGASDEEKRSVRLENMEKLIDLGIVDEEFEWETDNYNQTHPILWHGLSKALSEDEDFDKRINDIIIGEVKAIQENLDKSV